MATTTAAASSHLFGTRVLTHKPSSAKFQARLDFLKRKAPERPKKSTAKPKPPTSDRLVWFPGANPPDWLDGTMIGDRGFYPFGFGKPAEYLQFDLDSLDQNLAKNVAGEIIGGKTTQIKPTPFQPYTEVFGLQGFRECELIHGRWAMLGTLGAIALEALTGVAWQDAGEWNAVLDPEKRLYFDPRGLASDPEKVVNLKLAEIKHSRLAMVAFLIFGIQAAVTGKGPIGFVATFNQ